YQGDSILVDKATGIPLYKIYEDPQFIYFNDIRTGKNLMKLDTNGNLYVAGRVIQGSVHQKPIVKRSTKRRRSK
ncbi:MAG TPA: hypothetical protein VK468_09080, partial [Pyrinomonadaceae bacterium]|nr:hypothetical protein [Pyrinomonadaceae bacterium]